MDFEDRLEKLGFPDRALDSKREFRKAMLDRGVFMDVKTKNKKESCVICWERYRRRDRMVRTVCGHGFGVSCLTRYMREGSWSCPTCRGDLFALRKGKRAVGRRGRS